MLPISSNSRRLLNQSTPAWRIQRHRTVLDRGHPSAWAMAPSVTDFTWISSLQRPPSDALYPRPEAVELSPHAKSYDTSQTTNRNSRMPGMGGKPVPLPVWDRQAGKQIEEFMDDHPATYDSRPRRSLTQWIESWRSYDWLIAVYQNKCSGDRALHFQARTEFIPVGQLEATGCAVLRGLCG